MSCMNGVFGEAETKCRSLQQIERDLTPVGDIDRNRSHGYGFWRSMVIRIVDAHRLEQCQQCR